MNRGRPCSGLGLGLEPNVTGLGLGNSGLGLETNGLGLGLRNSGLGLGLETNVFGLGFGNRGLGLGFGLACGGLVSSLIDRHALATFVESCCWPGFKSHSLSSV